MTNPRVLDLDAFRHRHERIVKARADARVEFQRYGLEEADAEQEYRKRKAAAFARCRIEQKGVAESEIVAEGEVSEYRHKRDVAHVLRRSAELRIAELERNQAMLRAESDWSQRVDPGGEAA